VQTIQNNPHAVSSAVY